MPVRPQIIPNLRYADAPAAIAFLCTAFGFERHAVYANAHDPMLIDHAQLRHGDQLLMLASAVASDWATAAPLKLVAEAGGNTQSLYLVVADVPDHAERARTAGADIFMPLEQQDYGGWGYGARDPEGNAWSFGDYNPFAE